MNYNDYGMHELHPSKYEIGQLDVGAPNPIILIFFLIFAACGLITESLFGFPICETEIIQETISPNNEYKAVVFVRNCGATTDYSTHVSIIKAGKSTTRLTGGNIFRMDSHPNFNDVKVNWESDLNLTITYQDFHGNYEVFVSKDSFRDLFTKIEITYSIAPEDD